VGADFASGNSLFSGAAMIVLGLMCRRLGAPRWCRPIAAVGAFTGVLFVILSATPFSWWFYCLWASLLAVAWRRPFVKPFRGRAGWRVSLSPVAAIALTVAACLAEAATLLSQPLPKGAFPRLYVIGDSISAGISDSETTWPEFLAEEYGVEVVNLARQGATSRSVVEQAQEIPAGDALVFNRDWRKRHALQSSGARV
jgi:hypothetical protein